MDTDDKLDHGVDMEDGDNSIRVSVDHWKWLILFYEDLLLNVIRASVVLSHMKMSDLEGSVRQEVERLDLQEDSVEAARQFLRYLLHFSGSKEEQDVKAMWSLFDQALKSKYPWLHCTILQNGDVELQFQQQNLIHHFKEDITGLVDPQHLTMKLLQKGLLTQHEFQKWSRIHEHHGSRVSCVYMLNNIHRHSETWYKEFLQVMMENGYEELVKKIDDTEYQKIKASFDHDVSSAEEVYMSARFEGHVSGAKNLCGSNCVKNEQDAENKAALDDNVMNWRDGDPNEMPQKSSLNIQEEIDEVTEEKRVAKVKAVSDVSFVSFGLGAVNRLSEDKVNRLSEDAVNKMDMDAAKAFSEKGDLPDEEVLDNSNAEFDPPDDDLADVDDDRNTEPIKLRSYQDELAELGLKGRNVAICAPTGCGKTLVALKIMRAHLEQPTAGIRKIVFLVNQVALADQQYRLCKIYLTPYRCHHLSSDNLDATKVPLNELLLRKDVLVMTAQILLNAIENNEIKSICEFSMVVFDECHHTNGRHPFNRIMHHYMAAKHSFQNQATDDDRQMQKLPQVVGLTASVGVGKASNMQQAVEHIRKLCAHLDADYICTVRRNTVQLSEYSNSPEYTLKTCEKRTEDQFKCKIEEIMKVIEEKAESSSHTIRVDPVSGIRTHLHRPCERGTEQYIIWITQLRRPIAMLTDADARRFLETSRCVLEFYNTALLMNDDCDTQDAMEYLKGQFTKLNENLANSVVDVDIILRDLFDKNKPYLEAVCHKQANTNPKLIQLESMIRKAFAEEQESRAIIFVKTREMALCLEQWMKRRPALKIFKPGKIVGAGASKDQGGMTKNQQVDVMQYFRDGDHKIMVATSVAEEGLDIRQCNLVIRYNYVTNEIAMVQARGRARAQDSRFVTLASCSQGVAEKEEINIIREMMMHESIGKLQDEMMTRPTEYRQEMHRIQAEEKEQRDLELAVTNGRRLREGEVVLRCFKCDKFACMSSDIRTIEKAHHVIIDPEFTDRSIEKPHPKPIKITGRNGDMYKQGKLHCKNCGRDWGIVVLHSDTRFPVIKIESFIVVDDFDRRDAPRKWKNANFCVEELSSQELLQCRRRALASGQGAE